MPHLPLKTMHSFAGAVAVVMLLVPFAAEAQSTAPEADPTIVDDQFFTSAPTRFPCCSLFVEMGKCRAVAGDVQKGLYCAAESTVLVEYPLGDDKSQCPGRQGGIKLAREACKDKIENSNCKVLSGMLSYTDRRCTVRADLIGPLDPLPEL